MAVINLKNLVLPNVTVAGDVANGVATIGFYPVNGQALTAQLSPRHQRTSPLRDVESERRDHPDCADTIGSEAGRSRRGRGVLRHRGPALGAGRLSFPLGIKAGGSSMSRMSACPDFMFPTGQGRGLRASRRLLPWSTRMTWRDVPVTGHGALLTAGPEGLTGKPVGKSSVASRRG